MIALKLFEICSRNHIWPCDARNLQDRGHGPNINRLHKRPMKKVCTNDQIGSCKISWENAQKPWLKMETMSMHIFVKALPAHGYGILIWQWISSHLPLRGRAGRVLNVCRYFCLIYVMILCCRLANKCFCHSVILSFCHLWTRNIFTIILSTGRLKVIEIRQKSCWVWHKSTRPIYSLQLEQ